MNIDIKDNDNDLIEAVYELIETYDRKHITVWGNSSYIVTQKCYRRVSGFLVAFLEL